MLKLGYDAIHRFVDGHPGASWDGWDVVMWKKNPLGARRPEGALHNGEWGIVTRVSPNEEGKWLIRG